MKGDEAHFGDSDFVLEVLASATELARKMGLTQLAGTPMILGNECFDMKLSLCRGNRE